MIQYYNIIKSPKLILSLSNSLMENQQLTIEVDLQSFKACQFCLRSVPILTLQGFLFFLFAKELIKTQRNYDRIDIIVLFLSLILVGTDLTSILTFKLAISSVSHVLRLIWTLALFFTFLRMVFENKEASRIFITTFLLLILSFILSIAYYQRLYIRYPLLMLYIAIGFCSLHQILFIRQILRNQKARKKSLSKFLRQQSKKQIEIELIDRNQVTQYKVLSNSFKYHIRLRRSFCSAIMMGLSINYFFLTDLQESKESIGQFFVILISELLLPGIYYFYTTVNQWIIEKANTTKNDQIEERQIMLEDQL